MKLNRRERIRFDEQVAVQIADLVDNMREYHLGRTPSPILEIVRVYNTERAFAEKEPSSVKAFRIEPSELTEHIQKAWEIDAEVCLDRWEKEKTLTILRRVNGCIIAAEYSCKEVTA